MKNKVNEQVLFYVSKNHNPFYFIKYYCVIPSLLKYNNITNYKIIEIVYKNIFF